MNRVKLRGDGQLMVHQDYLRRVEYRLLLYFKKHPTHHRITAMNLIALWATGLDWDFINGGITHGPTYRN